MANETTSIGAAMANIIPMSKGTDKGKDASKGKGNPFGILGSPIFVQGDGKQYARQSGWGKDKGPHPDGGTNETAVFILFRPFTGTMLELQGRVYLERYQQNGKNVRKYSVSLPFLKAEKRDGEGRAAIERLKISLRDAYREWIKTAPTQAPVAVQTDSPEWVETDD
jgi:hypothetical protein